MATPAKPGQPQKPQQAPSKPGAAPQKPGMGGKPGTTKK